MQTQELFETLDQRRMPYEVARILRDGKWPRGIAVHLNRVAASHSYWYVSSMSSDFERAADCAVQLAAAGRMFGVDTSGTDPRDIGQVRSFIASLGYRIGGWEPGFDWKRDRLNKDARRVHPNFSEGLDSRRQYNRHVRVLRNLWDKAQRMAGAQDMRRLVLTGRSGFAYRLTAERFAADPASAAFVAYLAARKNERRAFTLSGRDNPVDELASALLAYALSRPECDAEMIAWVHPRPEVLARLTVAQLGHLLGDWHLVMENAAALLKAAWPGDGNVNRMTMIVRRGMDSSTWNTAASAYNAARSAWIGCVAAAGALPLLEPAVPGKVMRLMAADLAYWHRSSGGDVDANTVVFARLPLPWEVLEGTAVCTGDSVRRACAEAKLDPEASGWLAARPDGLVAQYRPTPDLVHGIAVADPAWALLLRQAGAFSGKRIKPGYEDDLARVPDGVVTGPRPVYHPLTGKYLGSSAEA